MTASALHFLTQQLSVGSALQNFSFYGMLVAITYLIIMQIQAKHTHRKHGSFAKPGRQ